MKVRTDFVTNSSSSSFIIAYKPDECGYNVFKFLDRTEYNIDKAVEINLNNYKEDADYYFYEFKNPMDCVREIEEYLKKGYRVVAKEIDTCCDDYDTPYILANSNSGNFVVLYELR